MEIEKIWLLLVVYMVKYEGQSHFLSKYKADTFAPID